MLEEGLNATGNSFDLALELVDLQIEPFRRDLHLTEARLGKDPENPELQAIRTQLSKEVHTRKLDYYRRKVDRVPTDFVAKFEMAVRLLKTGQVEEAIRELQALRSDPRLQGRSSSISASASMPATTGGSPRRNFEESLKHLSPGEDHLQGNPLPARQRLCPDRRFPARRRYRLRAGQS